MMQKIRKQHRKPHYGKQLETVRFINAYPIMLLAVALFFLICQKDPTRARRFACNPAKNGCATEILRHTPATGT